MSTPGIGARFTDAWLIDGVRTPFADYNGALAASRRPISASRSAREVFDAHRRASPRTSAP